jgi:hypothetical protein
MTSVGNDLSLDFARCIQMLKIIWREELSYLDGRRQSRIHCWRCYSKTCTCLEGRSKVLATASDRASTAAAAAILHQEEAHNKDELLTASFLKAHRLESISFTTAWRSMRLLNLKDDARKKSFNIDCHERDDVVENQKEFCKQYLTELEPYCRQRVGFKERCDEVKWIKSSITT